MSKHLSASEKLLLIEIYRNSNEKLDVFCLVNNISASTFKKWLKQYDEFGVSGLQRSGYEDKKVDASKLIKSAKNQYLKLLIENYKLKHFHDSVNSGWWNGVCSVNSDLFSIIEKLSRRYSVKSLCDLLGVSRSGYYKWKKRGKSVQNQHRYRILNFVHIVHNKHPSHGYRWTAAYIRTNYGINVSDSYVYKCYRYLGIKAVQKRYYSLSSDKQSNIYPNLVMANWVKVSRPRQVIVSDVTIFNFANFYCEVVFYFDVFTKEILTWRVFGNRSNEHHYLDGLEDIVAILKDCKEPTVLHTDQGSVYSSLAYNELIKDTNIVRSMSRAGTPTDNPINEALNRWIKEELVVDFNIYNCKCKTEFENTLCEYVTFYNEKRPCYAIGYETPANFRDNFYNKSVKV